eukprot:TRINITY_DN7094_c0_g1_i1.p1 TRINITY_DN7094_c0_g1~~TRINITY_DN7094_c0_g1_i1.p1  ORF type:complete len:471 (-),score=68.24 TRINITY_DN7094_c0_g1_i1:650-2062(-)
MGRHRKPQAHAGGAGHHRHRHGHEHGRNQGRPHGDVLQRDRSSRHGGRPHDHHGGHHRQAKAGSKPSHAGKQAHGVAKTRDDGKGRHRHSAQHPVSMDKAKTGGKGNSKGKSSGKHRAHPPPLFALPGTVASKGSSNGKGKSKGKQLHKSKAVAGGGQTRHSGVTSRPQTVVSHYSQSIIAVSTSTMLMSRHSVAGGQKAMQNQRDLKAASAGQRRRRVRDKTAKGKQLFNLTKPKFPAQASRSTADRDAGRRQSGRPGSASSMRSCFVCGKAKHDHPDRRWCAKPQPAIQKSSPTSNSSSKKSLGRQMRASVAKKLKARRQSQKASSSSAGASAASSKDTRPSSTGRMYVRPLEVRFSQQTISPTFRDGKSLEETQSAIANGTMQKRDIPPIRVFKTRGGNLYSHDNRRLAMYKNLESNGKVGKIKIELTDQRVPKWKWSTLNRGTAVRLRQKRKNHEKSHNGGDPRIM